jgi:uncharacterized coiled-coil protein SlyX
VLSTRHVSAGNGPRGGQKKRVDVRLTALEIKNAEDLSDLYNEVVAEVRSADDSSLQLEAKLRIKLQAVEIGLRVIEITSHEQRIAALEEQSQ